MKRSSDLYGASSSSGNSNSISAPPLADYATIEPAPVPVWRFFFDPRRPSGVGTVGSIVLWGGLLVWRMVVVMSDIAAGKPITAYSELFTTGGLMFLGFAATLSLGFVVDMVISRDRDRDAMRSVEHAFSELLSSVRDLELQIRHLYELLDQHIANSPDLSRCGALAEPVRGIIDRSRVDLIKSIPIEAIQALYHKSLRSFYAGIRPIPNQSMKLYGDEAAEADTCLMHSSTVVLLATTYVTPASLEFWHNEKHPQGRPYWLAYQAQREKYPNLKCVRIFVVAHLLSLADRRKLEEVIQRQIKAGVEVYVYESSGGSTRDLIEDDVLIVDGKMVSLSINSKQGEFRGVNLMWNAERVEHYTHRHDALMKISRRRVLKGSNLSK